MAIHETKSKWHDLIEDPTDLPGTGKYMSRCAMVLELNIITGEINPPYEPDLWWNPESGLWESTWDEYGDYGGTNYVKSYGIKPNYHPDPNNPHEAYSDDYVIVAWCEGPEMYEPNIKDIRIL